MSELFHTRNQEETLRRIQERLDQQAAPAAIIEEMLPLIYLRGFSQFVSVPCLARLYNRISAEVAPHRINREFCRFFYIV